MKVLFIRLSAIGDVIQGIPSMVALKETFPDWDISWLVEETSAPVLEGHPYLTRLFILKRNWRKHGILGSGLPEGISNFLSVLREIRREKLDAAIDLQGLFKSGIWTWLSGAPRRIGHGATRELAHLFLTEKVNSRPVFDPDFPLIERYLEPAIHLGADPKHARYLLPSPPADSTARVDRWLGNDADGKPLVALCPRTHWSSKNWPLEKWRNLASKLDSRVRLLLIGSEQDAPALEQIAQSAASAVNLCGKTSLADLMNLFSRCACVIGGDSGPMHLANAVSHPRVLMIFGSTSAGRSGPWGTGHAAISRQLSCQPCFERRCPLGHRNCLNDISEDEVQNAAEVLIKRAVTSYKSK